MRTVFTLLIAFSLFSLHAQEVHLRSGSFTVPENLHSLGTPLSSLSLDHAIFDGKIFGILQFHEIPCTPIKQELESKGVELLHYLPDNAFLTTISDNIHWPTLENYRVKGFLPLPYSMKIDPAIPFPNVTEFISVRIHFYDIPNLPAIIQEAIQPLLAGKTIEGNVLITQVDGAAIELWARLPFVFYIGPDEPERELESYHYKSNHRSNYLSDNPGMGLNFTGDGITLGVREGQVDDSEIDFQGRLDVSMHSGSISGHATGVARIMAGAGNEDPLDIGMAYGADIHSMDQSFQSFYNQNAKAVNNSYGWNCNWPGYSATSADNDALVRTYGDFMIIYSAGNIGGSDCGYGAGAGWGNITGSPKMAKNVIATGALDIYDNKMGFSSVGPATDGRIKPDMCAVGPGGTSHACPGVVGTFGQLYEAYLDMHGTMANGSLLKAILQNTAEDLGNPGPDFKFGYGRINDRRAYNTLLENRWFNDSVQQGITNLHTITVPPGTAELRLMLYWADYEGTPGAAKALVNDLDLRVSTPGGTTFLPWVLDPTPNPVNLDADALRDVDTLNNMEQVTIPNPPAGSYSINVEGKSIPQGPQPYFVTYEFRQQEIVITHPIGGESFVPGETEIIRWDATDINGNVTIEFSADSGANWQTVTANVPASQHYYLWAVPDSLTGKAFIRISQGGTSSTSPTTFSILSVPRNLDVLWSCADSLKLKWDPVPSASGYTVFWLGQKYMDSAGFTANTHFTVRNALPSIDHWFSIRAHGPKNAVGRRAIAIKKQPGDVNCVPFDAEMSQVLDPAGGSYPSCLGSFGAPLTIRVLNSGISPLINIPVAYQLNGGPLFWDTIPGPVNSANTIDFTFSNPLPITGPGIYVIKTFTDFPGDLNTSNDTVVNTVNIYAGLSAALPYTQNFDNFTLCSTAWGCEEIDCNLSSGWFNIPNETLDLIDWRTNSGATGSANTGPSGDHTSGNGNYLYLETSSSDGSGCWDKTAYLLSPCFDLAQTNQPELTYWANMYGWSIGELHVDVLANGQWHLDVMDPIGGDQGTSWFERLADLSAFENKTIVVRFRGTTGSGYGGDMALDDINLTTLPTSRFSISDSIVCPGKTVTLTDDSWYANNRQWQIEPAIGWSFVSGNSTSPQPSILISDTGRYTIRLITTNGRGSDTLTQTFIINAGPHEMGITADRSPAWYCQGDQATFTATLPAESYDFFVDGQLVQSSQSEVYSTSGLTDGQTVSVLGWVGMNCPTDTAMMEVRISSLSSVIQVDTPVLCFDSTTAVLSSFDQDFVGGLQYNWSTGANTPTIQNLGAGGYGLTVLDAAGCESTDSITLSQPNPIVTSFTTDAPDCVGDSTGSIIVSSMGGAGQMQYSWSSGQSGSPLTQLPAGPYYLTATDQNGCVHRDTVILGEPNPIEVQVAQVTPVACYSAPTGSATVLATGGSGLLSYDWSNGQTGPTLQGVASGSYNLTVQDTLGCTRDTVIDIPQIGSPISIAFNTLNPVCYGDTTGHITPSVLGAQGSVTYSWSNGDQTPQLNNLGAGIYHLTVTDTANCMQTDSVEITQPDALNTKSISATDSVCPGTPTGSAVVEVQGGSPGYTYLWSNGSKSDSIGSLQAGTYVVTVTDTVGCIHTDSVSIAEFQVPVLSVTPTDSVGICRGDSVQLQASPGFAQYTWSDSTTGPDLNTGSSGYYSVTTLSHQGCISKSDSVTVYHLKAATSNSISGLDTLVINQSGTYSTNGQTPSQYQWTADSGTITGQGQSVDISFADSGRYIISVLETSEDGCAGDTLFKQVIVIWPVGIDFVELYNLTLYPNPTDGTVIIEGLPHAVPGRIADVTGRLIQELTIQPNQAIDLGRYAQGMYILHFELNGKQMALPVIKH